jgi:hypothetical protein
MRQGIYRTPPLTQDTLENTNSPCRNWDRRRWNMNCGYREKFSGSRKLSGESYEYEHHIDFTLTQVNFISSSKNDKLTKKCKFSCQQKDFCSFKIKKRITYNIRKSSSNLTNLIIFSKLLAKPDEHSVHPPKQIT